MSSPTEKLDLKTWPIFHKMSKRGLMVSFEKMDALRLDVEAQMEEQLAFAEIEAGRPINPSSGDDVALWMASEGFTGKRTKETKRLATDERTLSQLPQHPLIDAVLEYRGLRKLLGTFIDPTVEIAKRDLVEGGLAGVVHPRWRLTKVRSGRVASEDPNLLAFPSRNEMGKKVRGCFVARPGYRMVSADFSQLEPRIVAGLSGDSELTGIFAQNRDLYTEIATRLGVTRTVAKILTLGILYGMGSQRLMEQLVLAGCVEGYPPIPTYPLEACEALIALWFSTYPGVRRLVESTVTRARMCGGWAFTVGGRGRLLPGLFLEGPRWPSSKLREEAERQAFNHLIQGTGMECLKLAMIRVDESVLPVWPLLAIHDELIYEVPEEDADGDAALISEMMFSEFHGVALKVSHTVGDDWGSLK